MINKNEIRLLQDGLKKLKVIDEVAEHSLPDIRELLNSWKLPSPDQLLCVCISIRTHMMPI